MGRFYSQKQFAILSLFLQQPYYKRFIFYPFLRYFQPSAHAFGYSKISGKENNALVL